jgi:hypothetical protein
MMELFMQAAKTDPQHWVLIRNVKAARAWFKQGGPAKHLPLELEAHHEFQLLERTVQPSLPGPLPENFAEWGEAPVPVENAPDSVERTAAPAPDLLERRSTLQFGKRLRVVDSA